MLLQSPVRMVALVMHTALVLKTGNQNVHESHSATEAENQKDDAADDDDGGGSRGSAG